MRLLAAGLFLILTLLSLHPIRSNDYPWHLATGRWIWDHQALPDRDPFAVASDDQKWINGEWLFDAAIYPLFAAVDHEGVAVAVALWTAGLFTFAFVFAARRMNPWVATLLVLVCWFGAAHRLDARPATAAIAFPPLAILILASGRRFGLRIAAYGLLSALWVNVHPSALLAPAIAGLYLLPSIRTHRGMAGIAGFISASLAGLLVNPHGVAAITAPLHLVGTIGENRYVNTEWLPSSPRFFPLLYLVIVVALVLLLVRFRWRRDGGGVLIFALFAVLAMRGVRSQDLFFAVVPFLLGAKTAAAFPALSGRLARIAGAGSLVVAMAAALGSEPGVGLDRTEFPVVATEQLERSGLRGTIYNPDQLGGYLAWHFYPERRHLIDGRHELFDRYIDEYAGARLDSRRWSALLLKYDVRLAVDEYHRETMTVVDPVRGTRRILPASMIYFPRERWALIAFDDVALVFARRDAHPPDVLAALEYRHLVPDSPESMATLSPGEKEDARRELRRARERSGDLQVFERMARAVN